MKKKILEMVSHKRQDTTATVIPCLYLLLFTVLRTLAVGLPVNKKRTRILSHRETGFGYELYGGELGTRTPDPLRVMQVL